MLKLTPTFSANRGNPSFAALAYILQLIGIKTSQFKIDLFAQPCCIGITSAIHFIPRKFAYKSQQDANRGSEVARE